MGLSFSFYPVSRGIATINTAMLQRFLGSFDPQALRQELDRRNEAGREHHKEPETREREPARFRANVDAYEGHGTTEKGSGCVDAAVPRSRAKSQQQRELQVWEAQLAKAWFILKGVLVFDNNILPSTMLATTRLVASPPAYMFLQTASSAATDVARFAPSVRIGRSPLPMSWGNHLKTLVDVFVALIKLGVSRAAPVSVSNVAQLCGGLRFTAKERSPYMTFRRVEFDSHSTEAQTVLIAASNIVLNDWLPDVVVLESMHTVPSQGATGGERGTRRGQYTVVFTRLRLRLDYSKGLTVVERLEMRGITNIQEKGRGVQPEPLWVVAAAKKHSRKGRAVEEEMGDGSGKIRRGGVRLVRGTADDGRFVVTDLTPELNFLGTQRNVCHDQWWGLEYGQPCFDREHYYSTHLKVDTMCGTVLGCMPVQMQSAASATVLGGSTASGVGSAVGGGREGGGAGATLVPLAKAGIETDGTGPTA